MRSIRLEVRGDGQEGLRSTQGRNPAEPRQMAQQSRRVYTQGSRPGGGHGLRGAIKNIGLGPSPGLLNQSLWGTSVFNMPPAWFQCAQTSREAEAVPAPPWEFRGPGFESSVAFWESRPHRRGEPRQCVDAGTRWASSVAVILVIKVAPSSSIISDLTAEENGLQ